MYRAHAAGNANAREVDNIDDIIIDILNYISDNPPMSLSKANDTRLIGHEANESHLLREIVRTHQVLMNSVSRKVGISVSRLALMRLLALGEGHVGVMDLARRLGIDAAAVTRQVKEMEVEGTVQRQSDSRDGRRRYIELTAQGYQLFEEAHERGHDLERALSAIISHEELATTSNVLEKLRNYLEEQGRPQR